MTTIHLTDAQRDQFAACGMFAVVVEPADVERWSGVVTLTATCEHLAAGTIVQTVDDDPLTGDWSCPECGADDGNPDGVADLGRFTLSELLPVSDHAFHGWPFIWVGPDYAPRAWLMDGIENAQLPLDPLPRPGQFVCRPERVA